jgi:hypothetical protein
MLGQQAKWRDFKLLSRETLNQLRAELTRQAEEYGLDRPTQWHFMETSPKGARRTPLAFVNRAHMHVLTECAKLRKDLARNTIHKKFTSEEPTVLDVHVWRAIRAQPRLGVLLKVMLKELHDEQPSVASQERSKVEAYLETNVMMSNPLLHGEDRIEVDRLVATYRTRRCENPEIVLFPWDVFYDYVVQTVLMPPIHAKLQPLASLFHVITKHVAEKCLDPRTSERDRETPELRWLQAPLGMSSAGYDAVRRWFYRYAMFDQPDNRCE